MRIDYWYGLVSVWCWLSAGCRTIQGPLKVVPDAASAYTPGGLKTQVGAVLAALLSLDATAARQRSRSEISMKFIPADAVLRWES